MGYQDKGFMKHKGAMVYAPQYIMVVVKHVSAILLILLWFSG